MSQDVDIINKLLRIEAALQKEESNTKQLKQVVQEIKDVVKDLDRTVAVHSEKHAHLFYRIEQLQREIESLEASGEKTKSRHQDLVEKALMAFLGSLLTYVYSLAGSNN